MHVVVAVLETMWDWRQRTTGAGYKEAPRYFQINPANHSGRRLYKLVGGTARLVVTNACRELVTRAAEHGNPDPLWLGENLRILDGVGGVLPTGGIVPNDKWHIDVLLVCGKVAQATFKQCGYIPRKGRVIEIPHPAARAVWTQQFIHEIQSLIQQYGPIALGS